MKIIESFLTKNPCYRNNVNIPDGDIRYVNFQKNGPEGLMIHSTGTPQPKASVFIKNWNKSSYGNACVHGFIEANGDVYHTLPWNFRGWHAAGSANNTHVGVEMTEPNTIKYTGGSSFIDNNPVKTKEHVLGTYKAAVELFAMLCTQYKLDPMKAGVIISHSEGYKRGVASNHGDVEHLWSKFGLTMTQFRKDIKNKMDNAESPVVESSPIETTVSISYTVRITASALNYRKGPGITYRILGTIKDKGIYTIVEEKNGWGKLKSGAGWIKLSYTKRL